MLKDKVAVITGGGSGIGRAIAHTFADHGANLVLIGRTKEKLERVAKEISQMYGKKAMVQVADVTNYNQLQKTIEAGVKQFGHLDILSHNAGIFPRSTIEDMNIKEWDEVIQVNLSGAFYALKACVPFMKKQKESSIVLTSSVAGSSFGLPTMSHYGASKAGMDGLMRSASLELVTHGIRVNCVAPSATLTFDPVAAGKEKLVQEVSKSVPMGRWAKPEEIAKVCLFLASDLSSYMTGQCLTVDGGQTILAEQRHLSDAFLRGQSPDFE